MRELLLFAGTTEGRMLSEHLAERGIRHTVCVATEYGEIVLARNPLVTVRRGRMEKEEIKEFIEEKDFFAVADATHPYAREITRNIRAAVREINDAAKKTVPCFRLEREALFSQDGETEDFPRDKITCFETDEDCAAAVRKAEGNILLTTGSKTLPLYCVSEEVKSRLYVRVLPGTESFLRCEEQGIRGRQIIAMQGPFTEAMNEATIRQYGISVLVTKESGASGGFPEKAEAVKRTGIKLFVIERPGDKGNSFSEVCREIEKLWKEEGETSEKGDFQITLAGVGMGNRDSLTREVRDAIDEAEILLGAERMLEPYQTKAEKHPYYLPEQILPHLREIQEKNRWTGSRRVVVLFSGDTGFYSGCGRLYRELGEEIRRGTIRGTLRVLPGISCVAALAARIGESWQDAAIYSMHGKKVPGLIRKIKRNEKTFLLTGGVADVNRLGALLEEADMRECGIAVGFQLSYREEQVRWLSPGECRELKEEGLHICMVRNPHPEKRTLIHGMADEAFIRDKVPMTKQEVRAVSICKLQLYAGAVVYDIGSGTGSVAAEMAGISEDIQVYAVERKEEAVSLIRKNSEKFGLENITVVEAQAPDGLAKLPAATHVFIGGSGGHLREILEELRRRSSGIRVVINAVSLETICEIRECLRIFETEDAEIVQIQVNRAREAGSYHLMRAENPVWICAFTLAGGRREE